MTYPNSSGWEAWHCTFKRTHHCLFVQYMYVEHGLCSLAAWKMTDDIHWILSAFQQLLSWYRFWSCSAWLTLYPLSCNATSVSRKKTYPPNIGHFIGAPQPANMVSRIRTWYFVVYSWLYNHTDGLHCVCCAHYFLAVTKLLYTSVCSVHLFYLYIGVYST